MTPNRRLSLVTLGVALVACGGPSKTEALDAVRAGVVEDASCTLPLSVLQQLKMQYASKAVCVPREGATAAGACVEALAKAGFTTKMEGSYMVGWPDEVAGASLSDVPAYARKARNLLFTSCWSLSDELRGGRFTCAEAKADKVLRITKKDDTHVDVHYERVVTYRPELAAIESACGTVSKPSLAPTVTLTKTESGWSAASADVVAADAGAR